MKTDPYIDCKKEFYYEQSWSFLKGVLDTDLSIGVFIRKKKLMQVKSKTCIPKYGCGLLKAKITLVLPVVIYVLLVSSEVLYSKEFILDCPAVPEMHRIGF